MAVEKTTLRTKQMFTTFFFSIKKTMNKNNHLSLYILLLKKKIVPVIF